MSLTTINSLAKALSMIVLSRVVCDATLLTGPSNSVAVIGDRIELECSVDANQSVIWAFTSFKTSKETDFYFGDRISSPFASRYRIDKRISGQHNLIIDSVDTNHTGKYQCLEIATSNKTVAHLTVLESAPKCSVNTRNATDGIMENDYLSMRCSIVYSGSVIPIFSWTKVNTQNAIPANTSNDTVVRNDVILLNISSSLRVRLNHDDNGVVFKCRITFQLPNNSQGNASEYEFTWNHTANVLYGPRNVTISRHDDRLVCSADGNPTPNYKWIQVETNRSIVGQDSIRDADLDVGLNMESTFECTAVNVFGNQTIRISLWNNATTTASSSNRSNIAAATVGGSLILFLIILIIAKCFVNSRRRRVLKMKEASCLARNIEHGPNVFEVDLYSHGSNAFRLLEHPETGSESTASYAMVNIRNDSLNGYAPDSPGDDHSESAQIPTQKKKRKNRVGADGTQYLDLSDVRQTFDVSPSRAATPPAIYRMNYALIDHTSLAPPPPPKL